MKAQIFTDIVNRNALRREVGLPTLNIRSEYDDAVRVAEWQEYHDFCRSKADERENIRKRVIADLKNRIDPDFGQTSSGRMVIEAQTRNEFRLHIEFVYGIKEPK